MTKTNVMRLLDAAKIPYRAAENLDQLGVGFALRGIGNTGGSKHLRQIVPYLR